MFVIGEYVIHANNGICQVREVTQLNPTGSKKDYYLLVPLGEKGSKIYTPVSNDNVAVRRVMTEEEAWELIDDIPNIDELWVDNDKIREARYKESVRSSDCRELVKIIKALYFRKQRRLSEGKKSTATDDKYFKIAEENLYSELTFAIGKEKDDMKELIADRIGELVES